MFTCGNRIKDGHADAGWGIRGNLWNAFDRALKIIANVDSIIQRFANFVDINLITINIEIVNYFIGNINIMLITLRHFYTNNPILSERFNKQSRSYSAIFTTRNTNDSFAIWTIIYEVILNPISDIGNYVLHVFSSPSALSLLYSISNAV